MKGTSLLVGILMFGFAACNSDKKTETVNDDSAIVKKDSIPTDNPDIASTPYAGVDISPMDMSYFPVDYPKLKMAKSTQEGPIARLIYSRPHLQGRSLFPDILKFGEPWRLGANEATELELFRDATIQDKKISAGRYVLYCIPQENIWTIVFNSNSDTWGLQPDASKDVARFEVPARRTGIKMEYFSMAFEKTDTGANLLMTWDEVEAALPISFN